MNTLIKRALMWILPGILLCAAVGLGLWSVRDTGYQSGYAAAKLAGDNALLAEKKARADERQQLAEAGQQVLLAVREQERAQRTRADTLTAQLSDKDSALQQAKALLQQNIEGAVSNDNKTTDCGFTGLGPRGLQLYEQALGYTGGGDTRAGGRAGH